MARHKFSVIVGMYNHLKYLPKLIESLENQTFKDFEVIFCDDVSNDGTKEFFENKIFGFDWKYKCLKKKKGMRLAKNINQGIKEATGEYCVFIMSDSFPELNYLESLAEYATDDRILCGVRIQVEGNRIVDIEWRIEKGKIPKVVALLTFQPYLAITGNGLVIPTEALRIYGGWNEKIEGYGGDDNELVARLFYKGYLVWSIPHAILYHNYHKSTADNEKNNSIITKLINQYAGIPK